jgi:hypothetical protein
MKRRMKDLHEEKQVSDEAWRAARPGKVNTRCLGWRGGPGAKALSLFPSLVSYVFQEIQTPLSYVFPGPGKVRLLDLRSWSHHITLYRIRFKSKLAEKVKGLMHFKVPPGVVVG